MGYYGVVQVGRLALREDDNVDANYQDQFQTTVLSVNGQESVDRLGYALTSKRLDDIMGLRDAIVPVTFSHKSELDGFYRVVEASGTNRKWVESNANVVPWALTLERIGFPNEVNLESRLSGPLTRKQDFGPGVLGKRWHAPPGGHYGYAVGSATPPFITRTGLDGAMTVYTDIPITDNAFWSASPANYPKGRTRITDPQGVERVGTSFPMTATGWTLTNGLVRVQVNATTGAFEIAAWTGGSWKVKSWELFHSTGPAVTLGVPNAVSVLRNEYEMGTVRIIKSLNPGVVTVDFTLRRGSRFVEVYVQHQFGTTLKLVRSTVEASASSTGYIRASAADADGNRFVLGSARSFTADNVNGGISKAATATLDAFIGVEIASAPTGDQAAQLFQQYLGSPAEAIRGVKY